MNQKDYENLVENMYVVGNSNNRKHLDTSIEEARQGQLTIVDLNELWASVCLPQKDWLAYVGAWIPWTKLKCFQTNIHKETNHD